MHYDTENSNPEILRLQQELQVYKIETSLQNQSLQQSQHELELALSEHSELYEFTPVGLFTLDCHSRILRCNQMGEEYLGNLGRSLTPLRFQMFLTPDCLQNFNSFLYQVFEGEGVNQKCEVILANGSESGKHLQLTGSLLKDKDLCLIAAVEYPLSIADRIQNHEFRNYMAVLQGAADYLLDTTLSKVQKDFVNLIKKSSIELLEKNIGQRSN